MRLHDRVDRRALLAVCLIIYVFGAPCLPRASVRTARIATSGPKVSTNGCRAVFASKEQPTRFGAAHLGNAAYDKLPIVFESALQKRPGDFPFKARGNRCTLLLAADELLLACNSGPPKQVPRGKSSLKGIAADDIEENASFCLKLKGSNRAARCVGEDLLKGRTNYFIGNDPSQWRTDVPTYRRVRFEDVYPGIDLAYYGRDLDLEYDLIIAPGADAHQIRLSYPRAGSSRLTVEGDLEMVMPAETVLMAKPKAYQPVAGSRVPVAADYDLRGAEVGFRLGEYDPSLPLVIDPVLSYSTLLGGSQSDEASGIAVDAIGNAYVTGFTYSLDFPLASPFQSSNPYGIAFVSKLNASGTGLIYSTFIGGSEGSYATGIAVDENGSAYVTGNTDSLDFPMVNAFQSVNAGAPDVFVTKFSPSGSSLIYSTYLGGAALDSAGGIAVDNHGAAYVTGRTSSQDFPTMAPVQGHLAGRFNSFITRLDSSGHSLGYSTYLGGSGLDQGNSVTVDSQGNAYVAGSTTSPDFPTVAAFQSTFHAHTLTKSEAPGGTWSPSDVGLPSNVGVLGITVDPTNSQILFAGTNGAGLFKSDDAGGRWAPANSGLILRTVKTIAVDPANHNIVYAGGVGPVQKSTDGGGSWHPTGPGLTGGFIEQMLVYPTDHNTVFAGTGIGLFITHNGGSNWSQVEDYAVGGLEGKVLITDPTSPSTVFVGTARGLFRTVDGGITWTQLFVQFGAVASLVIDPSNHLLMYAGNGGSNIFKSTDGGAHWTPNPIGIPSAFVSTLAISANSSLYAATLFDGILQSTDAGGTWQPMNAGLSSSSIMALALGTGSTFAIYEGSSPVRHGFVAKINATGTAFTYSTLLGGDADDTAVALAVDSAGSVYVAGNTFSVNFPTAGPIQPSKGGFHDGFVTKLSPSGTALMYSTYVGGGLDDLANSIALDDGGNAYVAGSSFSSDLHVVSPLQPLNAGGEEVFVVRLNSTGAISYSTYLGGQLDDMATGIAVDSNGNAYVAGNTTSPGFPVTPGSLKSTLGSQDDEDAFVVKVSPSSSTLAISSATISGKHLLVFGSGFDDGAVILLDGQQQKTQNDLSDPTTKLIARKAGKKIAPGQQVTLQVKDFTGALSPPFLFRRSP